MSQPTQTGATVGNVVLFAVFIVPTLFGGVGLAVMLAGNVVGVDLSPGWITLLAAVPTAVLTVKFWRAVVTTDDR